MRPTPAGTAATESDRASAARSHGQSIALSSSSPPPTDATPEIILTLGDILSRIPTHLLRSGLHDADQILRLRPTDLEALDTARPTVLLARLAAQCPGVFEGNAPGFSSIHIPLPPGAIPPGMKQTRPPAAPDPVKVAPPSPPPNLPATEPPAASAITPPAPPAAPATPAAPARRPLPASIELSLAAILKRCPREIIVSPLPRIDGVRITLPFAPIAQQLPSGKVEITALRFIAALPPELMDHFHAIEGVKVPLPLQEIFKHLPAREPAEPAGTGNSLQPAAPRAGPAVSVEEAASPPAQPLPAAPDLSDPSSAIEPSGSAPEITAHDHVAAGGAGERAVDPSAGRAERAPGGEQPSTDAVLKQREESDAALSAADAAPPPEPHPPAPSRASAAPLFTPAESGALAAMAPPRIRPFAPPPPILAVPETAPQPPDVSDLAQLSETLAALPGLQACVIVAGDQFAAAGALPAGTDAAGLRTIATQLTATLRGSPAPQFGEVRHVTIHGDAFSLSFFLAADAAIAAVVRTRSFLPGVCERLRATAAQLATLKP